VITFGIVTIRDQSSNSVEDNSLAPERYSAHKSDISALVSLRLADKSDPSHAFPKSQYSLSELNDLESKLVLITGGQSEHKEMVDFFKMVILILFT